MGSFQGRREQASWRLGSWRVGILEEAGNLLTLEGYILTEMVGLEGVAEQCLPIHSKKQSLRGERSSLEWEESEPSWWLHFRGLKTEEVVRLWAYFLQRRAVQKEPHLWALKIWKSRTTWQCGREMSQGCGASLWGWNEQGKLALWWRGVAPHCFSIFKKFNVNIAN